MAETIVRRWEKPWMLWLGSLNPVVPRGRDSRAFVAKRGQRLAPLPLWLAPKLALYLAMRDRPVNNSELARRLAVHARVIRRMLDPEHASKAERIQALAAFPRWRAANRRPARAFGVIGFAGNRRYPCIAGFRFGRPSEAGRRNSSTACAG